MFGGWRCDEDERLGPAGPTVAQALRGAAQRGAVVRGLLWRSHPSSLGYHLQPNLQTAAALAPVGAAGAARPAGPPAGLPPPEVRRRPAPAATWRRRRIRRRDRPRPGQPRRRQARRRPAARRRPSSTRYGPTPAWHDVHVQLHGPGGPGDRGGVPRALGGPGARSRGCRGRRSTRRSTTGCAGCPAARPRCRAAPPAPARAGTCAVQVLRTYPPAGHRPRSRPAASAASPAATPRRSAGPDA